MVSSGMHSTSVASPELVLIVTLLLATTDAFMLFATMTPSLTSFATFRIAFSRNMRAVVSESIDPHIRAVTTMLLHEYQIPVKVPSYLLAVTLKRNDTTDCTGNTSRDSCSISPTSGFAPGMVIELLEYHTVDNSTANGKRTADGIHGPGQTAKDRSTLQLYSND